jgi:hypothetical protein
MPSPVIERLGSPIVPASASAGSMSRRCSVRFMLRPVQLFASLYRSDLLRPPETFTAELSLFAVTRAEGRLSLRGFTGPFAAAGLSPAGYMSSQAAPTTPSDSLCARPCFGFALSRPPSHLRAAQEGLSCSATDLLDVPFPVPRRGPSLRSGFFARFLPSPVQCAARPPHLSALKFNEAAGFPSWYGPSSCTRRLVLTPGWRGLVASLRRRDFARRRTPASGLPGLCPDRTRIIPRLPLPSSAFRAPGSRCTVVPEMGWDRFEGSTPLTCWSDGSFRAGHAIGSYYSGARCGLASPR